MLTRWQPFDWQTPLQLFQELREQMDRLSREWDPLFRSEKPWEQAVWTSAPKFHIRDYEDRISLMIEAPGLNEKDFELRATADGLTISGERKILAPEGYAAHRQERISTRFSRSFTFPCKVEVEKITAALKDGILTVDLPKAPEAKPRQIQIKVK